MANNNDISGHMFKPCPFCGGQGRITGRRYIRVVCKKCGAETGVHELTSSAIAAWERREG